MKHQIWASLVSLLIPTWAFAQSASLGESTLLNVNGDTVKLETIEFNDKLMIEFSAPGLPVSDIKINSISEVYEEWIQKTGFKVILITHYRPSKEIIQQAKQYSWPFEIYFDPNHQFYQTISQLKTKPSIPKSYVLNSDFEILDVSSKGEMIKREMQVDYYDQDFIGIPEEMRYSMNEYLTDLTYYYDLAKRLREMDQ